MFSSKKCDRCTGKLKDDHSFCPFCGLDLRNPQAEARDFGMLGKNDNVLGAPLLGGGGMGVGLPGDFSNIFAQVMKMMEGQIKNMNQDNLDLGDSKPEIRRLPNGFQIKIGPAMQPHVHKQKPEVKPRVINDEQRARMVKLPRAEAKTQVRRLSDKVVYELNTPGVITTDDIFVSKVESGYEVKAVGNKKVYLNSLQIDLPIKRYSVKDNKVTIEFGLE